MPLLGSNDVQHANDVRLNDTYLLAFPKNRNAFNETSLLELTFSFDLHRTFPQSGVQCQRVESC